MIEIQNRNDFAIFAIIKFESHSKNELERIENKIVLAFENQSTEILWHWYLLRIDGFASRHATVSQYRQPSSLLRSSKTGEVGRWGPDDPEIFHKSLKSHVNQSCYEGGFIDFAPPPPSTRLRKSRPHPPEAPAKPTNLRHFKFCTSPLQYNENFFAPTPRQKLVPGLKAIRERL